MDASGAATAFKYRAFISYSHRDERSAAWLHKSIEGYRVPKPLIGQAARDGAIPSKIFPVFRDRDELASSPDLSASLRLALQQSAYLIALCSPAAAASRWVNQEILEFKRLGRADRILALIIEGEPNATDPAFECFPPALKYIVDADGQLSQQRAEPIAADLRPQGDGKDSAKLKLIAGLLGVSFNDLRHRELIAARRRARVYQGIAAAMILLAVLATVGGWLAWRYAQEAEARLGQAVDIAASFVARAVRLGDSFGVPRFAIEELLTQADASFDQLMNDGTQFTQLRSRHALLLMVLADHYGIIGKAERQLDTAKRARGILEALVADHPSDSELLQQLATSNDLIGDALANQLQIDEALTAYRAALSIREKLVANNPADLDLERGLSLSQNKLGDILFRQGRLDKSLAAFRAAGDLSKRLARAEPENLEWQRDVLVIHHKIGDVLVRQGALDGAAEAYRTSLAIAKKLVDGDPSNAQLQRDLSASQEKIGNIFADQGDMEGALTAYKESLAVAQRLAASDPMNIAFQRDLSLSHGNVGRILAKQNHLDDAIEAFRASLAIAEQLAAANPRNALFQRDLSVALNRIGDALTARGQLQAALEHFRRSLAIREQLAATEPASTALQRDKSLAHDRIGNTLAKQGRVDEAIAEFQVSLGIAARLSASDPTNAGWRRDLYTSYRNLGLAQERGGYRSEARETYCRAKQFILTGPEPEPERQQRLDWLERRLGEVQNGDAPPC